MAVMAKEPSIRKLEKLLGKEWVTSSPEDLLCYSFDATGEEYMPQAVVFPQTHKEVAAILRLAWEEGTPVIPRGAGSGFTGGTLPVRGGVVVSTERMNRILEVDEKNLTALVEPGTVTEDLQKEVEKLGLFYPPDPASLSFCTLGGNVAENAGGPRAVKYGVTRDYVLGLEAVLPDGETINTGRKVVKDVVGYDLTRLLVGSEGTLAFFTKILLRLLPLPPAKETLLASFPSREQAGEAVSAVIRSRIVPTAMEFMDRGALDAVQRYAGVDVAPEAAAVLLIEVDGQTGEVSQLLDRVAQMCQKHGGEIQVARDDARARELWRARRAISPSLVHIAPTKINEDIVVPRSELPKALARLEKLEGKYALPIVCFGHAGDGNIHVNIMTDRKDPERWEKAQSAVMDVFRMAVELGGTLSGEHGVGITKAPHLHLEIAPPVMELFKGIKKVFDPRNILNPGKMGLD
jgi:glycolate oxidase